MVETAQSYERNRGIRFAIGSACGLLKAGKRIATGYWAFDTARLIGRGRETALAIKGRFKMLRFPVLASALIFAASLAHAEMLPAYDSEAICAGIAGGAARQELIMRGCLDFQERTRKEIALAWDKLPATVQDSCDKTAKASGGDYWRLKNCIDREAAAAAPGH